MVLLIAPFVVLPPESELTWWGWHRLPPALILLPAPIDTVGIGLSQGRRRWPGRMCRIRHLQWWCLLRTRRGLLPPPVRVFFEAKGSQHPGANHLHVLAVPALLIVSTRCVLAYRAAITVAPVPRMIVPGASLAS